MDYVFPVMVAVALTAIALVLLRANKVKAISSVLPVMFPDGARTIACCPRCGNTHKDIDVFRLHEGIVQVGYWGMCPETAEPVMVFDFFNPTPKEVKGIGSKTHLQIITDAYRRCDVSYIIKQKYNSPYSYLFLIGEHMRAEWDNKSVDECIRNNRFIEFFNERIASY